MGGSIKEKTEIKVSPWLRISQDGDDIYQDEKASDGTEWRKTWVSSVRKMG